MISQTRKENFLKFRQGHKHSEVLTSDEIIFDITLTLFYRKVDIVYNT